MYQIPPILQTFFECRLQETKNKDWYVSFAFPGGIHGRVSGVLPDTASSGFSCTRGESGIIGLYYQEIIIVY